MKASPVLIRELRTEARNPLNYWFRLLGAGAIVATFALMMINQQGSAAQLGARLFRELNGMLFLSIAIFVPMLTADCLSREKREGTLGLLFLTPLAARDIVIGKSLIHTVRAFTLLLAALPILLLPFLLGGVTGMEVTQAITANLSALLLALSAGLLASVRNVEWVRAVVVAELLNGAFLFLWGRFSGLLLSMIGGMAALAQQIGSTAALASVAPLVNLLSFPLIKLAMGADLLVAIVLFGLVLQRAVSRLQETWQEEITAAPQPKWVKFFSTSDFWRAFFHWNKSRTLDRNPIAWLQEYSWTARLTKWGWFGVILLAELFLLTHFNFFAEWQIRLGLLLGLGMAFSSAWSFRRERQSGALELLLVTPLRPRQLIGGRLWGLWAHFFPAVVLFLFLWFFNPFHRSLSRHHASMFYFFCCTFLTLPLIGLHFSLLRWHFLVSWLLTAVIGLLLPYFVVTFLAHYNRYSPIGFNVYRGTCALQCVVASYAFVRLYRNLTQRTFALEHGN